jgi:hypothetical protein
MGVYAAKRPIARRVAPRAAGRIHGEEREGAEKAMGTIPGFNKLPSHAGSREGREQSYTNKAVDGPATLVFDVPVRGAGRHTH